MCRRLSLVVLGTLIGGAVLLLGARPAQAKEGKPSDRLVIIGPGLSSYITVSGEETLVWDRDGGAIADLTKTPDAPKIALGPRYSVTLAIACGEPGAASTYAEVSQDLYPYPTLYGNPAPWTYTPPGQVACGGSPVKAGWYPASPDLFSALIGWGLPSSAPSIVTAPRTVTEPNAGRLWVLPVAAVVALLVLVGAALARSKRANERITM